MPAQMHIALLEWQLLAGSDADLQFHQIETRDHLGHRMLNLQPRVHLQEIEIPLRVHQKFDRTRTGITGRL